jgi:quercetin dioxygenase-like cupin family protein
LILAVFDDTHDDGDPNTVVDVEHGLRWTLAETAPGGALLAHEVLLDAGTDWLLRHDRVDFEPGGIAYRHTHPGPGIRVLLFGEITIDSEGARTTFGPRGAWFEAGPDPVRAETSTAEPSAFARVMLVPAAFAGQRTIRYVDAADAERPRRQKATVFSERPVA